MGTRTMTDDERRAYADLAQAAARLQEVQARTKRDRGRRRVLRVADTRASKKQQAQRLLAAIKSDSPTAATPLDALCVSIGRGMRDGGVDMPLVLGAVLHLGRIHDLEAQLAAGRGLLATFAGVPPWSALCSAEEL